MIAGEESSKDDHGIRKMAPVVKDSGERVKGEEYGPPLLGFLCNLAPPSCIQILQV